MMHLEPHPDTEDTVGFTCRQMSTLFVCCWRSGSRRGRRCCWLSASVLLTSCGTQKQFDTWLWFLHNGQSEKLFCSSAAKRANLMQHTTVVIISVHVWFWVSLVQTFRPQIEIKPSVAWFRDQNDLFPLFLVKWVLKSENRLLLLLFTCNCQGPRGKAPKYNSNSPSVILTLLDVLEPTLIFYCAQVLCLRFDAFMFCLAVLHTRPDKAIF